MTIPHRRLGRTGLTVSQLGLGGLLTSSHGGGVPATRSILRRAFAHGFNLIDTAPAYGDSEATLGRALSDVDLREASVASGPLIVTTKLGGRPDPFDPGDAAALRRSVETSLELLGVDAIDVLFVHEPDRPQQYRWWTSYEPLAGPVLDVLDDVRAAGLVRFVGLGGTTVSELTALVRTGLFDVLLTAFQHNALFREALEELIPAAAERDMGILVGSVLGQGSLARPIEAIRSARPVWMARRRHEQLLRLYDLSERSGLSLPALGLRHVLADDRVSSVLIGARTPEQLDQTVDAASGGPLPADIAAELDEIADMLPRRPFEEPMILPLGREYYGPGRPMSARPCRSVNE